VLSAANGTPLHNVQKAVLSCCAPNGPEATISATVPPDVTDPLIGKKDLIALGVLSPSFPAVHVCATTNMIKADNTPPSDAPPDVETPPPLSAEQVAEIEKVISKIKGEAKREVERIRGFLTGAADVMVCLLGDAAGCLNSKIDPGAP
jgi:hypothetical protein